MVTDLILGTAGHIDHGKTSLIRSLTGVDTDRLPEEKRRGITIELGFAELVLGDFRLGIVDVPGHERFVRQMLAGATGMDLALLVVAADDSVKPQTREHLDVLRLLDLEAGVVALTKADAADDEWIALVEEEVRELVRDTFLADAAIVRTSATTGEGIDALNAALREAAEAAAARAANRQSAPFRMAIDRAFSVAGHGTVVTGSVSTGRISVGDQLVLQPMGLDVRVRGLHNHDREVESVVRGQRAAINVAGVTVGELGRGNELSAAGHLVPSRLITADVRLLDHCPRALKRRDRVRLHIGTAEVAASILPLQSERLEPGEQQAVQLILAEPIVATWGQPFVVRSISPVATLGGGTVLVPDARKIRRPSSTDLRHLQGLAGTLKASRAEAAIYFADTRLTEPPDLMRMAGIEDGRGVFQQLLDDGTVREVSVSGHRQLFIHQNRLAEYAQRVVSYLNGLHDDQSLRSVFDRDSVANQFAYLGGRPVFDALVTELNRAGTLRLTDRGIGLAARGPQLSKGERKLRLDLLTQFRDAGCQPPSVKECEAAATKNQQSVRSLIELACTDGDLVEIANGMYLHADVLAESIGRLRAAFGDSSELTVSEIRELLATTRKFALPICSYLDRVGFTVRDGDLRRLSSPEEQANV